MAWIASLWVVGFALATLAAPAAQAHRGAAAGEERGFPLIEARVPDAADAGIQNFGVAAGPDGLLYVANLGGLLVYDGAWWELLPVGASRTAFGVGVDGAGRVAVGGFDDFGHLAMDDRGRRRYVSLLDRLPEPERSLGQVLTVLPYDGGFLFLGTDRLVAWRPGPGEDGAVRTLVTFSPDPPYTHLFPAAGAVWWWGEGGLGRVDGPLLEARLVPVPGGEAFRGRRVDLVLPAAGTPAAQAPAGETAAGGAPLLVSVRGEGLFLLRDGAARPFAPAASRWAVEHRVLAGQRLADGRWVLGSVVGGLLVLRPDGTVDQVIDSAVGLPDDLVYDLAVDREGGLWVALNTDLARIPVASPLSVLDRRAGLQGSVYTLIRHRGALWVGTAAGLFRVRPDPEAGGPLPLRVEAVPDLPPSVWSLRSAGDDLLVGTARGVYRLRPGAAGGALPTAEPVAGAEDDVAYVLAASPSDPDRVWMAGAERLVELRRGATGSWSAARTVEGGPPLARSLVERDGVLWCGTELDGVVGVELPLPGDGPPRLRRIPSADPVTLVPTSGGILAARGDRVLRLDGAAAELVEDPALAAADRHGDLYFLAEDAAGNLWLNTQPPAFVPVRRDAAGAPRWDRGVFPLAELPVRSVEQLLAEPDGTVWLAGSDGLYRHAGPPRGPGAVAVAGAAVDPGRAMASEGGATAVGGAGGGPVSGRGTTGSDPAVVAGGVATGPGAGPALPTAGSALPPPILARVTADGDRLLFAGRPGVEPPSLDLEPDLRRMRLAFAPLSFRPGLRYQVRLDPVDADWGPPTDRPFTEITRLAPGTYTLRVRTVAPEYAGKGAAGSDGGAAEDGGGSGAVLDDAPGPPGDGPGADGVEGRGAEVGTAAATGSDGVAFAAEAPGPLPAGVSPEVAWTFRVLPPWYRTPGALLLWIALVLVAFTAWGRLRSRSLRRRAAWLEGQVGERTRELEQAVAQLRRTQGELEEANHRLTDLSLQDELTGIANRRRLQDEMEVEWRRARRHGHPLSFILLDLDHFKLLNDTRGHREGDETLRAVARYLDGAVAGLDGPEGALVVRYGGEEFAVLLPETGLPAALRIAESLRAGLEALDLPHAASPEGRITASLGVATTVPSPGERPESLVDNADHALYRAKTDGRNLIRADGMEDDSGTHRPVPH